MVRIHLLACTTALLLCASASGAPDCEKRVAELERKLQQCQQKRIELLQQCDKVGCLNKVASLQSNINDMEDTPINHHIISSLQRSIAEQNRKLLSSMSDDNKVQLKQLLREYAKLWQELCKRNPQDRDARQSAAFELFFI